MCAQRGMPGVNWKGWKKGRPQPLHTFTANCSICKRSSLPRYLQMSEFDWMPWSRSSSRLHTRLDAMADVANSFAKQQEVRLTVCYLLHASCSRRRVTDYARSRTVCSCFAVFSRCKSNVFKLCRTGRFATHAASTWQCMFPLRGPCRQELSVQGS